MGKRILFSMQVMVDPGSFPGDVQIVPVEKLRKIAKVTSTAIPPE